MSVGTEHGEGVLLCVPFSFPARRFARLEVKTGLAKILDRFEVWLSPKMVEPLRKNPRIFINKPLDGARLVFEPCAPTRPYL